MKSTPAEMRAMRSMSVAATPQIPGAGVKMRAVKCTAIRTQPVSQCREAVVWPRRATDAKAHVSAATAARSGSLLQSTRVPQFVRLFNSRHASMLRMNEMVVLLHRYIIRYETCVILRFDHH